MLFRMTPIIFILLCTWQGASAQYFPQANDAALKDVLAFDARVVVLHWIGVESDREQFSENAKLAFEVALRRDGVIVNQAAPNYLICKLSFSQSAATVFFTLDIQYWEKSSDGLHALMWEAGGIATVGIANLNHTDIIRVCVDDFTNQWLKHNPR